MNISIQSPNSTLSFGNTEADGGYASLSTVGTSVTTKGLVTAGAVLIDGSSDVSKKNVVRMNLRVRVPLFDVLTPSDSTQGQAGQKSTKGKSSAGFAQVALTVNLPNTAGIVASSSDIANASGIPLTQAAANATAVALGLQVLLNAVCNQGSAEAPVLASDGSLMDYSLLGSDVQNNPIARGLMGLRPLSGSDRGIVAVTGT